MDIPRATSFYSISFAFLPLPAYFGGGDVGGIEDGLTYLGFLFHGVLLRVGKVGSDGVEGMGLFCFYLQLMIWGYGSAFLVFSCEGTVLWYCCLFSPFKWRTLCLGAG